MEMVKQGADAQPVPSQKQAPPGPVPEGKCKLAVQTIQKIRPLLFVEVDQDFCIRFRVKPMSLLFQIPAEFKVVEDFTVIDNPDGIILVVNGLVAAGKVDDAQARVGQADLPIRIYAERVGASMANEPQHPPEKRFFGFRRIKIDYAGYATHFGSVGVVGSVESSGLWIYGEAILRVSRAWLELEEGERICLAVQDLKYLIKLEISR